jgi:hypothetical protein
MKAMIFRRLLAVLSVAAVAFVALTAPPQKQAFAAQTVLCAPNPLEGTNARTVGGTGSQVPSGTVYVLNGQGCTVVAQGDVGYFLSQGYTAGPPFAPNCLFTTGVWTGTTSFQACTLPVGTYIQHVIAFNSTANAVTGGIAVGTTSGAADVVTAQTCAANCLVFVSDATLSKRIFSTTAGQPIFVTPVTAGNNANVTFTIVVGYF